MIYLIRHTKPEIEKGICYGQSDLDVSDSFNIEKQIVLSKIKLAVNTVFISSPLKRCYKLAEFLSGDSSVSTDDRLMELNFGDWELKKWENINEEELKFWGDNYLYSTPPQGESFTQLHERTVNFWKELNLKEKNYVITAHDGVIKSLLCFLLEIPLRKAFSVSLNYGDVVKVNVIDEFNCNVKFL